MNGPQFAETYAQGKRDFAGVTFSDDLRAIRDMDWDRGVDASFVGATFAGCTLDNIVFGCSDFSNASFRDCSLDGTCFAGSMLTNAAYRRCTMHLCCAGPFADVGVIEACTDASVGLHAFIAELLQRWVRLLGQTHTLYIPLGELAQYVRHHPTLCWDEWSELSYGYSDALKGAVCDALWELEPFPAHLRLARWLPAGYVALAQR